MNELQLIKSDKFGLVEYDIYSDGKEMFMTISQLAACLGYSSKDSIKSLLSRNEYLKQEEFSKVVSICNPLDNSKIGQKTRVFTEDGIYEVTMLAKTEVAKEFRARVRKVLKALRSGEITAKPSKALETSEYHYIAKTLNGEPVITLADFEHFIGITSGSARHALYNIGKDGEDYKLLTQSELASFKIENPSVTKAVNALVIIRKSGVDKLIKHFGCNAEIPQMIESKPLPAVKVIEVSRFKSVTTEDCITALNVLLFIKKNRIEYQMDCKERGDTDMVEYYDKDIEAITRAVKDIGSLVYAGY